MMQRPWAPGTIDEWLPRSLRLCWGGDGDGGGGGGWRRRQRRRRLGCQRRWYGEHRRRRLGQRGYLRCFRHECRRRSRGLGRHRLRCLHRWHRRRRRRRLGQLRRHQLRRHERPQSDLYRRCRAQSWGDHRRWRLGLGRRVQRGGDRRRAGWRHVWRGLRARPRARRKARRWLLGRHRRRRRLLWRRRRRRRRWFTAAVAVAAVAAAAVAVAAGGGLAAAAAAGALGGSNSGQLAVTGASLCRHGRMSPADTRTRPQRRQGWPSEAHHARVRARRRQPESEPRGGASRRARPRPSAEPKPRPAGRCQRRWRWRPGGGGSSSEACCAGQGRLRGGSDRNPAPDASGRAAPSAFGPQSRSEQRRYVDWPARARAGPTSWDTGSARRRRPASTAVLAIGASQEPTEPSLSRRRRSHSAT